MKDPTIRTVQEVTIGNTVLYCENTQDTCSPQYEAIDIKSAAAAFVHGTTYVPVRVQSLWNTMQYKHTVLGSLYLPYGHRLLYRSTVRTLGIKRYHYVHYVRYSTVLSTEEQTNSACTLQLFLFECAYRKSFTALFDDNLLYIRTVSLRKQQHQIPVAHNLRTVSRRLFAVKRNKGSCQ